MLLLFILWNGLSAFFEGIKTHIKQGGFFSVPKLIINVWCLLYFLKGLAFHSLDEMWYKWDMDEYILLIYEIFSN